MIIDEVPESETRLLTVSPTDKDQFKRLDHWLVHHMPDASRSTIKRLFEDGNITTLDGSNLSLNKLPKAGVEIEVELPPPVSTELKAQNIPLEILFEDEHLIVIVKPAGMCVHPAPGHPDKTLVNAVLYHCPNLPGIGGEIRPGIVHRLDLGTSGVMVVAKSQAAHEALVHLFSKHDIERAYEAILWGTPHHLTGKIETFINRNSQNRHKMSCSVKFGKKAITNYKVLKSFDRFSLVEFRLHTGRTHQIRVHASQFLQTPVACDPVYSDVNNQKAKMNEKMRSILVDYQHQLLHAKILGFTHPITGEKLYFEAPLPEPMKSIVEIMNQGA